MLAALVLAFTGWVLIDTASGSTSYDGSLTFCPSSATHVVFGILLLLVTLAVLSPIALYRFTHPLVPLVAAPPRYAPYAQAPYPQAPYVPQQGNYPPQPGADNPYGGQV